MMIKKDDEINNKTNEIIDDKSADSSILDKEQIENSNRNFFS